MTRWFFRLWVEVCLAMAARRLGQMHRRRDQARAWHQRLNVANRRARRTSPHTKRRAFP